MEDYNQEPMTHFEELCFNEWSLLIPVLTKIGIIISERGDISRGRAIYFHDWSIIDLRINEVYEEVLSFIEYYNELDSLS